MKIACPICAKITEYDDNPNRLFCSERCKLVDLGEWASEGYKVPTNEQPSSDFPDEQS